MKDRRKAVLTRRQVCRGLLAGPAAALLLGGCSAATQPELFAPEPEDTQTQTVTLQMPGRSDEAACRRISQKLSELTRSQCGFAVQLIQTPRAQYENTQWQQLKNGGAADVFYLPAQYGLYGYIYENGIYPLSALLADRPALYDAIPQQLWRSREYGRVAYGVPARETDCYRLVFLARTDLLAELGASPAQVTGLDSLHTLLLQARQRYPDVIPVVPQCGCTLPPMELDPLNDGVGVLLGSAGTTVVNWYASEEYRALCSRMYGWAQEGLVMKSGSLRQEEAVDLLRICGGLGWFARLGADQAAPAGFTALPLGPMLQNNSGLADSWVLPVYTSAKRQALQFLELLYTDETAARLFVYGEQGVDDQPGGESLWSNDCVSMACLHPGRALELPEDRRVSPAYGLPLNVIDYQPQIAACTAVQQQYHDALMCGCLNPEEALPLFLQDLDEAGIHDVIEAKQRRLDANL